MTKASAAPSRRSDARRATMLTVAWEVFLEYGYTAASMSDIAERLGGSKSTLYSYFRSKQELFLAVVEHKGEDLHAALTDLPTQTGDLASDLTDLGCRLVEMILSDEYVAFYRLIVAEASRMPMIDAASYELRRHEFLGPLGKRLQDEMKAGRLRVADPFEAGEALWNLCSATMHRRSLIAMMPALTHEELRHSVDRAVTIFLAAYSVPGRTETS